MKRKTAIICILALILSVFSGCCLKHEWAAATCEAPETCASCGKTQGEPLGHSWQAATCEVPETCDRCGKTQGAPLGHSWQAATCEAPETCAACGETQGEPVHDWNAATCEDPELCSVCGASRGDPLGHVVEGGYVRFLREWQLVGPCSTCDHTVTVKTDDWNWASKRVVLGKWYVYADDVRQEDRYIELREDGTVIYDFGNGTVTTTWMTVHDSIEKKNGSASSTAGYPAMLGGTMLLCQYIIEIEGVSYTMYHASPVLSGEITLVILDIQLDGMDGIKLYHA